MIKEYLDAYKKILDYNSIATRKDFNYFNLCFIVIALSLVTFFCIVYLYVIPEFFNGNAISMHKITDNLFGNFISKMSFWFGLINCIPLLALIKRRLNDIDIQKSKIYFMLLILVWIIGRYWKYIFAFIIMSIIKLSPIQFIDLVLYYGFFILVVICNITLLVSFLILMIKKGSV